MNPDLDKLQPYPFQRLAALKGDATPPEDKAHIALSIGEPKHEPPAFVLKSLSDSMPTIANYPTTKGLPELRQTICDWLSRRFKLPAGSLDKEQHVLPVNGTREALFAFAQAVVEDKPGAKVLMPNPFYQIYEGAAFLAGAEPHFLNCNKDNGYQPDFDAVDEDTWDACQLLYLCTPGNPTGAVISEETLQQLIKLSLKHDFVIASDECYSELYFDETKPPVGLLQAAASMGHTDYKNCVVFHSLSKRSNLPGMRSGFVAGDAAILEKFLLFRTYHGCAMPLYVQHASITAWQDEGHVKANRNAYRNKFEAVLEILSPLMDVSMPDASFYLWPDVSSLPTPMSDEDFARELFAEQHITVLPGSYLSRDTEQNGETVNPGANHVRMALVATEAECLEAANRIKAFIEKRG